MHDYTKRLRAKGYTAKEAAARWGITPRQFSKRARNPKQKDLDWLMWLPDKCDGGEDLQK